MTAIVDGTEALTVTEPKGQADSGDLGLFVDIGTEGYFSNLRAQATD